MPELGAGEPDEAPLADLHHLAGQDIGGHIERLGRKRLARCDDPGTAVRWSSFTPRPTSMESTYQSFASGGCTNTTNEIGSKGIVQRTNAKRTIRDFEVLHSGF